MAKAIESCDGRRPTLRAILQADFETRARWHLGLNLEENQRTLSEVVRQTSADYGHLWSNINSAQVPTLFIDIGSVQGTQGARTGNPSGGR